MIQRRKVPGGFGIGIGREHLCRELVEGQYFGDARFRFENYLEPIRVVVSGKAVFIDFEAKISGSKVKIEFECKPGSSCRFLCKLGVYEIIKNFYTDILDNCLGKTLSEQQAYVFRYNEPEERMNCPLSSGLIERSEEYIRNLPDYPTDKDLEYLCNQVISNDLEYAYHAKDESGVKMHQYANALLKKL